jgi:hypothetical protein
MEGIMIESRWQTQRREQKTRNRRVISALFWLSIFFLLMAVPPGKPQVQQSEWRAIDRNGEYIPSFKSDTEIRHELLVKTVEIGPR